MDPICDWKDIASIAAALIALLTLIKAVFEYTRQAKAIRAKQFFEIRAKLDEDPDYTNIIYAIDDNPELLCSMSPGKKRDFLAYIEEIALLVNSNLVPLPVAYYMFGYYIIKVWDSKEYWENLDDEEKNSRFWILLRTFVGDLKIFDQSNLNPELIKKVKF